MSAYPHNLDVRPLTTWPGQLTADSDRRPSPFRAPLRSTLELLDLELYQLGAEHPVLEVAIPFGSDFWRLDGRPRANARAEHPGVVLSLPLTDVGPLRYATDLFTTWQDNLRAIALALQALRKVDRYGVVRRGEQYMGFAALPPGGTGLDRPAAIQIVARWAGITVGEVLEDLPRAWRKARAAAHPDRHAGNRASWDQVETAGRVLGVQS